MSLKELLLQKAVLTHADIRAYRGANGANNDKTMAALLAYHLRKGHLVRVRRGLYLVVPPGASPETCPVDPYLLAAKMTDDAVLAYHTALEVHGKAHSVFERFYYLSNKASRPATFRACSFQSVRPPGALCAKKMENFSIKMRDRMGIAVRVTSLERTLVDVLDRPELGGGWEELWRSLESVEFFDLDVVVEYALLLDNATTAAKVGYFLDQHRRALMVEDKHLLPLKKRRPKSPHYLERRDRSNGHLVSEWNLFVPARVAERSWEEQQ